MADTRISDLSEETSLVAGDEFVIASGGVSQKVKFSTLARVLGDNWVVDTYTWTYVNASSFKVIGADVTSSFPIGTKVRLKQGAGYLYFVVSADPSYTGGDTAITLQGGSSYTLANAAITDNYYSYGASPNGWPGWFNFSPTYAGFSADPSGGVCRFAVVGRTCVFKHSRTSGTSNASNFTITLPFQSLNANGMDFAIRYTSSGSNSSTPGMIELASNSSTATLYTGWAFSSWGTTSSKNAVFTITYEF